MAIRPWEIERQRGTVSAPTPFESQTLEREVQRGAQRGLAALTQREGNGDSTGAQVVDTGAGGSTGVRNTPFYPTTLPPLSPEMLNALEQRRRASLRGLQEAEARAEDLRARAELEEIGRRLGIQEDIGRRRREGFMELAGRGVARSPMYANPFRRELARTQQEQMAESQQTLANTLDQLQVALNAARQKREQELAQIAFDETMARSNVQRLLGID